MGQAKNRGSKEQRIQEATKRKEQSREKHAEILREAIEEMNLPPSTEFCGFVVHFTDTDEFLAGLQSNRDMTHRQISKIPDLAKRYDDYESAAADAAQCKGRTTIAHLFDVGSQYVVAGLEDPNTSESEEAGNAEMEHIFGGEGAIPITDDLIKDLVTHYQWSEQDLIRAKEAGALYSLPRNSLIFPPEFG